MGKKRIGLVLASIHTGVSRNMWASFVRSAVTENSSLFIFPGGRLNAPENFENLRNPVYLLANEENLDGCISWSSSIIYAQSQEKMDSFHSGFDSLPYVTLGYKSPGHPCVIFDAYNGMKHLVNHCIKVHGAKKIAFLRGPNFNQPATERLEGYYSALKEAGLLIGSHREQLVTSSFDWHEGAAAAAELYEQKKLTPGKDFDTLIGSSDLMTLGAVNYFAENGFHVPVDYHAAGFNNSQESRATESLLSTVNMPFTEASKESFKLLLNIMNRKKKGTGDVLLNCEIIIRESCGCVYPGDKLPQKSGGDFVINKENLVKMVADYLKLEKDDVNSYVMPVIHSLLYETRESFFRHFEKSLVQYFNAGKEPDNLLKLINDFKILHLKLTDEFFALEPALYSSIIKIRERINAQERHETARWNTALNSLKCDLLGTRNRISLVNNLAKHLPGIGINTVAIVLYKDEKTSIFVGGFSVEGIDAIKDVPFPSRLLVPMSLKPQYSDGIFMVQPLFINNFSLGYFVHNAPINNGVIFEELRSSVSYALKGIFLLEETIRAKRIAEQAEQAKTDFLQFLENGLFNPLQGVEEKLEIIQKKCESGKFNGKIDVLLDDIKKTKAFVSSKEAEAGSIMDFTLAKLNELSLRKTIFDLEELLPKIGAFPLLAGDTLRLVQCFTLIREQYEKSYSAEITYDGLSITFHGKTKKESTGRTEMARQFGLLLAERVILMHGGDFSLNRNHCKITLPWPTLTGHELYKNPVGVKDHVFVLSQPEMLPDEFSHLLKITDMEKTISGKTAFVVWNAAGASSGDFLKVVSLKNKSRFAGVPFLCYGMPAGAEGSLDSAAALIDTVEFALKSKKKRTVLFIGCKGYSDSYMEQLFEQQDQKNKKSLFEKIHIDSMASFNDIAGEVNPSLIVFNSLNIEGAIMVRRHPFTVMVPMLMICEKIDNAMNLSALNQYSRLIICHSAAVSSQEFKARIQAVVDGAEILPPHTGALVKKTIHYFDQHIHSQFSRWKLADSINASEDYLSRIFHREMGLSLWDYLSRLRIFMAADYLRQTDDTIQEIASRTGFHDHAYFCRVFKKIYGVPPGHLRK
ncbi:MAG: helix-turn-helix domain-containing protein [Treponema sp.]|jgi:DNA-binding LacI/PurR family transcriptional regulator/AraC-like DNA-binding protein|nr:helix-turn-helix domain-containing protein [Treponema sp.]